jgi:hypothetical protein
MIMDIQQRALDIAHYEAELGQLDKMESTGTIFQVRVRFIETPIAIELGKRHIPILVLDVRRTAVC